MNILLLSFDSLRADRLGCYGYRHATSPNLDALVAGGARGERMYACGVPTSPSHTSQFTGLYPLTHGIVTHRGGQAPRPGYPWLPRLLQGAGFTTAAVDNLKRVLPWFTDAFEFYVDPSHRSHNPFATPLELVNTRAIPWLRAHAHEGPWFLFLHAWDPHAPYLPPLDVRTRFYEGDDPCDPANDSLHAFQRQFSLVRSAGWFEQLERDLGRGPITDRAYIEALYDAEIFHMDRHFGELMNVLDELGQADDTLVLGYGDHGEMMGENDIFFDHHSLYEGNLRVPLVARWPAGGVSGGQAFDAFAQHVDVTPTLLEAAGVPVPEAVEGKSLLRHLRGETDEPLVDAVYAAECTWQAGWCIRTDTHKLIVNRGPAIHNAPPRELFDLRADPLETTNVYYDQWETAEALELQLDDWIAAKLAGVGEDIDPVQPENISLGRRWLDWAAKKRAAARGES